MTAITLIDERVSISQSTLCINSLHKHESGPQNIWLTVNLQRAATITESRRLKPCKIPLAHPLVDPRTSPICLISHDSQSTTKTLLETHNIKFISLVLDPAHLKSAKYKSAEARDRLLSTHGMFLADERLQPTLPKLLGAKWFEAKKQPIPVRMTSKNLKTTMERAVSSTHMNQNQGTCVSIKISTLSHTPSQTLANLSSAIPHVANNILGGWDNIASLAIKTGESVSLPLWDANKEINGADDLKKKKEEAVPEDKTLALTTGSSRKRSREVPEGLVIRKTRQRLSLE